MKINNLLINPGRVKHSLYRLLPLFVLCLCQHFAIAQNRKLDSLNQLIAHAETDTARIRLVNARIKLLSNINLDSSIYYGLKNLSDAQKAGYYKGEVAARLTLATNYCFKGDYNAAKTQLDYLKEFTKSTKDSLDIADVYSNYGMLYGMQSVYDTSIIFYAKSIDIIVRHIDTFRLGTAYSNISIGYQQQGNFPAALHYQQMGLKLAEARKNETSQAYIYLNMASTYDDIGDSAKAEECYLKAADLAIKNNLKNVELYDYSNLSSHYISKGKWDKAYEFAMKSAGLAVTFGDQGIQAAGYSKAANARANQGKFEEALTLSRHSIILADSSNQPLNISKAYNSMGNILFLQKKYKEAIPYYEKNFEALKGADIYSIGTETSYKELAAAYENTGNYVKALANFKMAFAIADSVKRKDNVRKTTELSMNFEFEKKQEVLAAEQKKEEELAKTKQLSLLIGLIFVLLLGFVTLIGYRNKQKANRALVEKNRKIESTLAKLKNTQTQLIQSEKMASLGELTAGIAHEIQNPLNFINNFSEVNQEIIEELLSERLKVSIERDEKLEHEILKDIKVNEEKINHHGKRADAIVKGMLQHSRSGSRQKELTDINKLADEYLRLSYHGLRAKDKSFNADFKTDFDEHIGKINIIPQDIGRVILNLLTNAFYAVTERQNAESAAAESEYKPLVTVTTRKIKPFAISAANNSPLGDGGIEIIVTDNGNGIPQNIVDKIFQPFFTTKPSGKGTGLGLSLSYDIVKAHGGEIKVETREGEGTTFVVQLHDII